MLQSQYRGNTGTVREALERPTVAAERMVTITETRVVTIEKNAIGNIEVAVKKGKVGRMERENGIEVKRGVSDTIVGRPLKKVQKENTADIVHIATLLRDKAKIAMVNLGLAVRARESLGIVEEGRDRVTGTEMAQLMVKMVKRFRGHVTATGIKHFLHMTQRRKEKTKMEKLARGNTAIIDQGNSMIFHCKGPGP